MNLIGHVMKRDASQQSSWTHVVAHTIITCANCLLSFCKKLNLAKPLIPGRAQNARKLGYEFWALDFRRALGSWRLLQSLGVESLDLGCRDDDGWRTLSQFDKAGINPIM